MEPLQAGDILSYSAGSTQTGPDGYRKLRGGGDLLAVVGARWPDLITALGERPALFINAYPATIGAFASGITVDTYLSARILSRALQLAQRDDHPVILVGQPLFLADALIKHVSAKRPLPETLLIWVGGYVMPGSLEAALSSLLAPHVDDVRYVQFFGAAEVDAGCFMGRERTEAGEVIYYPRADVDASLEGEKLLLSLRSPDGRIVVDRFPTGDSARREGDGWLIWNHRRLHPDVHAVMESWTDAGWMRRTGYVRRTDDGIWLQLREGVEPDGEHEVEHFDFARRFGFAWLNKPYWR